MFRFRNEKIIFSYALLSGVLRRGLYSSRNKLEDLTVLKRSPDLLNNVKIGQDQLQLIMKHILFYGG